MANWTSDPPAEAGFYWFASGVGRYRVECPAELFIDENGGRRWAVPFGRPRGYKEGNWPQESDTKFGPRIPSPDELEAMAEYIAASEAFMVDDCPPYGSKDHREMTLRWDAARSALKKIREADNG